MNRVQQTKNVPLMIVGTLLVMYVITGLALLGLAFLLYKLQFGENVVQIGIMAIYVISCLIGGMMAGKQMGVRRFLWGLLIGGCYFGLLMIGSFLLNKGTTSDIVHCGMSLVMCMAAGMIGGMLRS